MATQDVEDSSVQPDAAPPPQPPTTSSAPPPSLDALAGPPPKLVGQLQGIQREKVATENTFYDSLFGQLGADRERAQRAYDAAGVGPDQLVPWNEQVQREKFRHDPIESFGSLGSVFGIIASAFTHAPMENAMNASAAAINAINANDDREYERAHTAWKENMELVVRRHGMQRAAYQDAITLMNTDMAVGEAKARALATRFGDQKTLALLDNGMVKEWVEYQEAQNKMVVGAKQAFDAINTMGLEASLLQNNPNWRDADKEEDPMKRAAMKTSAWMAMKNLTATSQEAQLMGQFHWQNPDATARESAEFYNFVRYGGRNQNPFSAEVGVLQQQYNAGEITLEEYTRRLQEVQARSRATTRQSDDPFAAQVQQAREDFLKDGDREKYDQRLKEIADAKTRRTGSSNLTGDRQRAQDVAKYREELAAEKNEDGSKKWTDQQIADKAAQREKELKAAATPTSANRRDEISNALTRHKLTDDLINEAEALLKKHNALTGLGGKITRPAEAISNVFGKDETDRKRFEQIISELREFGPRLLTGSHSRPLAVEAGNMEKIIPGLQMQDTTLNTARRLREYQDINTKLWKDLRDRYKGEYKPPEPPAGGSKAAPSGDGEKPWERDRRLQNKGGATPGLSQTASLTTFGSPVSDGSGESIPLGGVQRIAGAATRRAVEQTRDRSDLDDLIREGQEKTPQERINDAFEALTPDQMRGLLVELQKRYRQQLA